ncbi:hypothetical protein ACHAWF_010583, partial [Thalassiosira exigua]
TTRTMKRPLRLIGTTTAATTSLLLAGASSLPGPTGGGGGDGGGSGGGGGLRRAAARRDGGSGSGSAAPVRPVPPAPHDGASGPEGGAGEHRPHPSYLDAAFGGFDDDFDGGLADDGGRGRREEVEDDRRRRKSGSDGAGRRRLSHATTGTFKNLVLLLRFSDHADRALPSRSDISRLYNSESSTSLADVPDDDVAPTGSVREAYLANSHGRLRVETTVVDWIDLPDAEAHYAAGNHGFRRFKDAISAALDVLDARGDFDFAAFDLDENGALDGFGVLHSGYGAEFSGEDCEGARNVDRIWSHKGGLEWTSSPADASDPASTVGARRYYASSSLRNRCGSSIVRMGVLCHELGHYLGLPDLYDPTFNGTGLGNYDFMAQSWGWDGSGLFPPHLSAWSKLKVGWATAVEINADGAYELEESAANETVYKISRGYPEGEYLLLENRQARGYDANLPRGGIAAYHVDEKARGQSRRGYPTMREWPTNGDHYEVALLGADGSYDLERGANQGDGEDLWREGTMVAELRPGDVGIHPNTDSYQGGIVVPTGIRIFDFSASGDVMSFRVEGLGSPELVDGLGGGGGALSDGEGGGGADVSVGEMFSSQAAPEAEAPSAKPTPEPTAKPTPEPTAEPTSEPTPEPTPEPSPPPTPQPSPPPSAQADPSASSVAASSSSSPSDLCSDLCLVPLSPTDCPPDVARLPDCDQSWIGQACDADGECGTDKFLNNCGPFDVYRRVECGEGEDVGGVVGGAVESAEEGPAPIEATGSMEHYHHSALDGMHSKGKGSSAGDSESQAQQTQEPQSGILDGMTNWGGGSTAHMSQMAAAGSGMPDLLEQPEDNGYGTIVLTAGPTASPSAKPAAKSQVEAEPLAEPDADCPFYPGWILGFAHCLKDCRQPSYMIGRPIFEFSTLEGCCDLHYGGSVAATCVADALAAIGAAEALADFRVPVAPRVRGRAWRDDDGDGVRSRREERMGGGVAGVAVDSYECPPDVAAGEAIDGARSKWIGGELTGADGSYAMEDLAAGKVCYLEVRPPMGYVITGGDWDDRGRSRCMLLAEGDDVTMDVGLMPVIEEETTELAPMAAEVEETKPAEDPGVGSKSGGGSSSGPGSAASSFAAAHAKARTSGRNYGGDDDPGEPRSHYRPPPEAERTDARAEKSGLRGAGSASDSSYASAGDEPESSPLASSIASSLSAAAATSVRPSDDATVRSDEASAVLGYAGELRVGPASSGSYDALLKFDASPFLSRRALPRRATVALYSLASSPSGGVVHAAEGNAWDVASVTWSAAPEVGRELGKIGETHPNKWAEAEVDATALLGAAAHDGTITLRISGEEGNHSWPARYAALRNREGRPVPELRMYF